MSDKAGLLGKVSMPRRAVEFSPVFQGREGRAFPRSRRVSDD